jgi:predicted anti-sigma-YlaC factor YlaD
MKTWILLIASAIAALALSAIAAAADVSLAWEPNNPPGTVAKFTVYEKVAGVWVKKGETEGTTFTVTGLTAGLHTFAVTASNAWGESDRSNETTTPPPANPPTNLRITTIVDVIVQPAPVAPR